MAITMTSAAQQHVRKHLEHRASGVGVRLGVRTTGCSGLSYVLEFVDSMETSDQIFEFDDIICEIFHILDIQTDLRDLKSANKIVSKIKNVLYTE